MAASRHLLAMEMGATTNKQQEALTASPGPGEHPSSCSFPLGRILTMIDSQRIHRKDIIL